MPRSRALSAAVACGLAVILMSGTGASYARWSDTALLSGAEVRSGQLRLEQPQMSITLHRSGQEGRPLGNEPLVAGDALTIRFSVALVAEGSNLAAVLTLDTRGLGGPDAPMTVDVDTSGIDLPPVPGPEHRWQVGPHDHGRTISADITVTIPASPDGQTADGSAPENRWGSDLQGQTISPGDITWSLTQNGNDHD